MDGNGIQRQREAFAYRVAANDFSEPISDLTGRLHQEFTDWATPLVDKTEWPHGGKWAPKPEGLVKEWPYVERFLKEKYPAAHQGFDMGREEARPGVNKRKDNPYPTGPDAVAQYGYDPREVAAGMLMLHIPEGTRHVNVPKNVLNNIFKQRMEMQRNYEQRQANSRLAAADGGFDPDEVTSRLQGEFDDWRDEDDNAEVSGGLNEWMNIEKFLRDKYPAAHRGLGMGHEMARPLLDGGEMIGDYMMPGPLEYSTPKPYETGPEAFAQLGYDPKEVAAGMLLLHNQSHHDRDVWHDWDQERLHDIAQKRFQMQRNYEQRQANSRTAMPMWYHLTDNPNFQLDPEVEPTDLSPRGVGKGVFLTQRPDEWASVDEDGLWSGDRPYVAEIDAPSHLHEKPGVRYNPDDTRPDDPFPGADEIFVPADQYHNLSVTGVKPRSPQERQANSRLAAVTQDMVDGLHNEFHEWWGNQKPSGKSVDDFAMSDFMDEERGPIGHWPNVENFLKEKYPAAHKGLGMGLEAEWSLDGHAKPYLTGPEAIKQHGYDPSEIAAGMLLLHNQSDPFRGDMAQQDQDRLNDIAQKRFKMQRAYDSRQPQPAAKPLVTANRVVREAMRLMATAPTLPQTGVIEPPQDLSPEDERRVIDEINDHLSYSRPRAAAELWAQSGIPLSNLTRSREIASHIRMWGFPQGIDSEWAQAELDDYTLDNYRRDPSNPLPRNHNEIDWDNLPPLEQQEGNLGSFEEAFGDDQMEDDEDDQSCPDCDFTTFFDRDMMRHRYIRHNDEDALNEHFGLTPYQPPAPAPNPSAPVENTTDPNAKLKSPWYKKVQHYRSGELPSEFSKRRLYDDFNFGEPEIGRDDGQGWYGARPNEGVYQINDSRRPLHKPPVGYVQYEADHDDKTVKIKYLDVHPKKRGQGVATALVSALAEDFPDYKIAPGNTTGHGTGFVNYMQKNAPGAKERLDTDQWNPAPANVLTDDQLNEWGATQRRSPVFAFIDRHNARVAMRRMRIAAFDQELIDRLRGEYHDWYNEHGDEGLNWAGRGPLGNWRQIENFMKTNYPAAHRGFNAGMETVGDILDHPDLHEGYEGRVYETGPEAVAQHGYDPKEVAAGMLLLHNQTHPQRGDILDADIDRLSDIAQKRSEMQRNYEQRQPQPITAALKLLQHLRIAMPEPPATEGIPIYRGMSLDLSKIPYHPEMGHDILKSLKSLGSHWSYNREVAEDAAGWDGDPVILHARWRGMNSDIDPALPVGDEDEPDAYYPDEEEVPLLRGTPLDIEDIHIAHPETGEFHSVFRGPSVGHTT